MHDHKEGFESCIQCGICTSGCPAARFTEYVPREIARRALEGDPSLLEDDSVWYCFYCYTCQSRCPRKNSVAVINQVIRSMQVESGYGIKHVEMFAEPGASSSTTRAWAARRTCSSAPSPRPGGPSGRRSSPTATRCARRWAWAGMYPAEEAVKEVQIIMEETGLLRPRQEPRRMGATMSRTS